MSHIGERLLIITNSDNAGVSYHGVIVDGPQLREERDLKTLSNLVACR